MSFNRLEEKVKEEDLKARRENDKSDYQHGTTTKQATDGPAPCKSRTPSQGRGSTNRLGERRRQL